jgi:hypothetical protein
MDPLNDWVSWMLYFSLFDNGIGNGGVLRGVAYEYVVRAGTSASSLLSATAFRHVDLPPTLTSSWQISPVFIKVSRSRTSPLERAIAAR